MNTPVKNQPPTRKSALVDWLARLADKHDLLPHTLESASSDASFRQYYRVHTANGTLVAMDSPPELEDAAAFIHAGQLIADTGIRVPEIIDSDLDQGFLLLTDLGRKNYWHLIQEGLPDTRLQQLYRNAIATLIQMQTAQSSSLPVYDQARLIDELSIFEDWYVSAYKQIVLTDDERHTLARVWQRLGKQNARSAKVFVHRDYHSPNLMIDENGPDNQLPGIIDYQDAVSGPITYDIASLVMDARTTWEEDQQLDWAIRYWEGARAAGLPVAADFADFHAEYEWMSLQRNLRILGVFARLSLRDNKHHYLEHLPRVNAYIRQVACRYGDFDPLLRILNRIDGTSVTTGYTF